MGWAMISEIISATADKTCKIIHNFEKHQIGNGKFVLKFGPGYFKNEISNWIFF